MVDEVNAALRGVDGRYFPQINYANAIQQGNEYVLFYVAERKGFKIGIVCGTDGKAHKIMFVADSGKFKSGVHPIANSDELREHVDFVGNNLLHRGK